MTLRKTRYFKLHSVCSLLASCFIAGACEGSDGPGGDAAVGSSDASFGSSDAGNRPDAGDFADSECFAASAATSAQCEEICARPSACSPSFGTCLSGCRVVPSQFDLCTASTDSCDSFRDCLDCTNGCSVANDCSPTIPEATCCSGCYANPTCIDKFAPVCEAFDDCI